MRLAAAVIIASALVPHFALATSLKSTYTDISSCRSVDIGPDQFAHNCRGPGGMAAVLYYFDGRAQPIFGPAGSRRDEVSKSAADALNAEPLMVGNGGQVFGQKIEWVSSGKSVCAGIVRVDTDKGSRLVVTALGGAPRRVAVVKGNNEAKAAAVEACDVVEDSQASASASASKDTSGPTRIVYRDVGINDPLGQRLWGDKLSDIRSMDGYKALFRADFKRGKDNYTVAQIASGYVCGVRSCETKLVKNGKVIDLGLQCDATDHHFLSADKRTITFCDVDERVP